MATLLLPCSEELLIVVQQSPSSSQPTAIGLLDTLILPRDIPRREQFSEAKADPSCSRSPRKDMSTNSAQEEVPKKSTPTQDGYGVSTRVLRPEETATDTVAPTPT